MASPAVETILRALLATNWTHTTIRLPNEVTDTPSDASAYADLIFTNSDETQIDFGQPGNNFYREEGNADFTLYVTRGEGLGVWPDRLNTLRGALRGYVSLDGHFRIYEMPPGNDANSDQLGVYALTIPITYEYDFLG